MQSRRIRTVWRTWFPILFWRICDNCNREVRFCRMWWFMMVRVTSVFPRPPIRRWICPHCAATQADAEALRVLKREANDAEIRSAMDAIPTSGCMGHVSGTQQTWHKLQTVVDKQPGENRPEPVERRPKPTPAPPSPPANETTTRVHRHQTKSEMGG